MKTILMFHALNVFKKAMMMMMNHALNVIKMMKTKKTIRMFHAPNVDTKMMRMMMILMIHVLIVSKMILALAKSQMMMSAPVIFQIIFLNALLLL